MKDNTASFLQILPQNVPTLPFSREVMEKINYVAYRLKLPVSWKIHNAFHILADKERKVKGKVARRYLVKFKNYPAMDAKWMEEERKKQGLAELKTGLDEAESLIRRMDLEARSLQPTQKAMLLSKLREYKSDLTTLRRELKRLNSETQVSRDELLEGGHLDPLKASSEQRDRLILSTERLNHSGERIKESKRTLLETEELGVSILQDLYQQRQTLLHTQDTLIDVDDNIGKSKKILLSMTRRMSRNKWIMGGLIGALVVVILFVGYVKLSH